jgi:Lon protease-like protein
MIAGALLVVFAVVSVLGRAGGGRAPIEVTGQPRLRVDREVVDLGEIRLGTTVEAAFVLTNVGDQPLRLTQAPYIEVVEGC